jgi:transposase
MKETITLTEKEQARLMVLGRVDRGMVHVAEAAQVLEMSERHVLRLLAAYRREGAAALAHGNRGRQPAHTTPAAIREQVVALTRDRYAGVNQVHLAELLAEREGVLLSRSTVRRILGEVGIGSPRTRRAPKHRSRRERYPQEGMLLQMDGSPHAWLEKRGPRLCLLAAVDDATGAVHAVTFRQQEDAHGYLILLRQLV